MLCNEGLIKYICCTQYIRDGQTSSLRGICGESSDEMIDIFKNFGLRKVI